MIQEGVDAAKFRTIWLRCEAVSARRPPAKPRAPGRTRGPRKRRRPQEPCAKRQGKGQDGRGAAHRLRQQEKPSTKAQIKAALRAVAGGRRLKRAISETDHRQRGRFCPTFFIYPPHKCWTTESPAILRQDALGSLRVSLWMDGFYEGHASSSPMREPYRLAASLFFFFLNS